jgi:hypothetical protein
MLGRVLDYVGPVEVLLLGEDETESSISSKGGFITFPSLFITNTVMNSGVPPGGGATSDVLRVALMHFHSILRRKVTMTAVTVETIAIPISFAISYESEQLRTEPGGGGTARDEVGFKMATTTCILYVKMWCGDRWFL